MKGRKLFKSARRTAVNERQKNNMKRPKVLRVTSVSTTNEGIVWLHLANGDWVSIQRINEHYSSAGRTPAGYPARTWGTQRHEAHAEEILTSTALAF